MQEVEEEISSDVSLSSSDASFESSSSPSPTSPEAVVEPSGSYRKKPKLDLQKDTIIGNAMKILGTLADSHQIFADYIADQLRNMTEAKQRRLKLLIQKAIIAVEEEPEPILTPTPVSSPLPPTSTIPGPSSSAASPRAFSQDMFKKQAQQYPFQYTEL